MTAVARKVTITAIAVLAALAIALAALPATSQAKTFPDVPRSAWYYDVVDQASDAGLITGYGDGKFKPNNKITRGQVATILWRDSGSPSASSAGFKDVSSGQYYTTAVNWCASNSIVTGYGSGSNKTFKPGANVTRQDLMVMLSRYVGYKTGTEATGSNAWWSLKGAADVSTYAQNAIAWGVDNGIIGSNGNLNPKGNATRAEAAKMILMALSAEDSSVQPGDIITLGSYEQDNDTSNGTEPIEWRVLAVEGGKALAVSVKGLDVRQFNSSSNMGNDWETSELKAWLEGDFTSAAFSSADMARIYQGPFCLSVEEAEQYLADAADRVCTPTAYAAANGAENEHGDYSSCFWWLRSPGSFNNKAVYVGSYGNIDMGGAGVTISFFAVRPALWVNL